MTLFNRGLFIFALMFNPGAKAWALDLSAGRSQSSSSYTNTLDLSHRFTENTKMSLEYSVSKETTNTLEDSDTNTLGVGIQYKFENKSSITTKLKKINEYYFYEGLGVDVKYRFPITSTEQKDPDGEESHRDESSDSVKKIRGRVGLSVSRKFYSKQTDELVNVWKPSVGFDVEITSNVTVGADFSRSFYISSAAETKRALDGLQTNTKDIGNYFSNAIENSSSIYGEISSDEGMLGLSFGVDSPRTSLGNRGTTTEIYGEYNINSHLSLDVSYLIGRSASSSSSETRTTSIGFSAGF